MNFAPIRNSTNVITFASTLTALSTERIVIGTRVTQPGPFLWILDAAISLHDFAADKVPGQGFLMLPDSAIPCVSAGAGPRTPYPSDYVLREYRGRVEPFLRREKAAPVEGVAALVYTKDAYLKDPDVQKNPEEVARVASLDVQYVLVAVLAFAGPKPPLTLRRFVGNLAGGNLEALQWPADLIREMAKEVDAYDDKWCTVAD